MRKDAVGWQKSGGLVQRQRAFFDEIKRGDNEREFENGLHRRVRVRIEIAIQRRFRQRAGYGDFAMGVGGNRADLLLERRLLERGSGEKKNC